METPETQQSRAALIIIVIIIVFGALIYRGSHKETSVPSPTPSVSTEMTR